MLADVFENFRNILLEIYEPYPTHFLSDPELALQAALKKTKVKSDILTDMLLMIINGWKRY